MLETNAEQAGVGVDVAKNALRDLSGLSEDSGANVEALSNLLESGFTNSNLEQVVNSLSGAVIKFPDTLKIEGLADGLQETLATGAATGPFAEMLERLGYDLDSFNEGLQGAIANGEEQNYVLSILASTGLTEVNEAYRENNKEMVENAEAQHDLQMQTAELGEKIEPIMTKLIEFVTNLLDKFNSLNPETQKVVGVLFALAAAIGPVIGLAGTLATGIGALITVFGTGGVAAGALGTAMTVLTGTIGITVGAIAGIIAIGVALYKNWDEVSAKAGELWSNVTDKFDKIKNSVTDKIDGAKDAVGNAIDKIKGFFDFEWSLPKLKLPHFKIKGELSLSPPSVPSLGVDWYKTGAVFNKPSIIGVGEAGSEAVIPLNQLSSILAKTIKNIGVSGDSDNSEIVLYNNIVLDGKVVARSTSRVQAQKNIGKSRALGVETK